MGRVTDQALAAAGLDDLRDELPRRLRAGGTLSAAERARLEQTDILALGALADHVRAALTGDRVRILTRLDKASDPSSTPRDKGSDPLSTGADVLRIVALARLTRGGAIEVDVGAVGLQLAQVALAFGADTLVVPPAAKRSLTGSGARFAIDLDALVRRAGRVPVFVGAGEDMPVRVAGAAT